MTLTVDRRQVLAYRVAAQGLHRDSAAPGDLAVLDLGVQETTVRSARVALAARLPRTAGDPAGDPATDPALTLLWSVRGAPHLHRTTDVAGLAATLWPLSDADALARLAAERAPFKAAGVAGLEGFTAAARALHDAVTAPTVKGEASAAVTARLPAAYSHWCEPCGATHVYGGLFQTVGVFAGVRLEPDTTPAVLAPLDERPPIPPPAVGPAALLRSYLRLLGPATPADAAAYLGSTRTALRPAWPDDLVEVTVDGRRAWLPAEQLDALRTPPPAADVVRLLPVADPYLQARDRDLLVPDRARRAAVWRNVSSPGAVLAGGEVAGVWRARKAGAKRLDITVQPFAAPPAGTRRAIAAEAERVAAARAAGDVRVVYDEAT